MLPSPIAVGKAMWYDAPLLLEHSMTTITEGVIGLFFGVLLGFLLAVLMDNFLWIKESLTPVLVVSQTIPTVAIAPLLVLWFGYEMTPKVILIVLVTFFPIAIGVLNGFSQVDKDMLQLLKSMKASWWQIFWHLKFPSCMTTFFASLKIAVSYSIVGAVISEWLGGSSGLGVYMTRVRKSFAFDKMFAVIFIISLISLCMIELVNVLQKKIVKWEKEPH